MDNAAQETHHGVEGGNNGRSFVAVSPELEGSEPCSVIVSITHAVRSSGCKAGQVAGSIEAPLDLDSLPTIRQALCITTTITYL